MAKWIFRVLLLWLLATRPLVAAAPPAAPAPATNAPVATAPTPVPVAEVVSAAVDDSTRLQEIEANLSGDHMLADIDRILSDSTREIEQKKADDDKLLAAAPTLAALRTAQTSWQMVSDSLSDPRQLLTNRIAQLDADSTDLGQMNGKWQATLATAKASAVPPDVIGRINEILATIAKTGKAVETLRGQMLSRQSNLALASGRVKTELDTIGRMQSNAVYLLFAQDSAPIWSAFSPSENPQASRANPLGSQVTALRSYVAEKFSAALVHLGIFLLLAIGLFWVRRAATAGATNEPTLQAATQILRLPIAVAAILALLLSGWFYPLAPRLFMAGLGAAALIPAVMILRRLIEPSLFPILYALVLSYAVDQMRYVASVQPLLGRSIFLVEMIAVVLFLAWLLRSHRLSQIGHDRLELTVRLYACTALALLCLSTLANLLGYTHLSYQIGNAALGASYLAVILYAAVRIADGLVLAMLKVRPFTQLGVVRRHYLMIAGKIARACRWAGFLFWLWEVLDLFSIRNALWVRGASLFTTFDSSKAVHPSLAGKLILCALLIWATFLVSRLVRFSLEEEVYPKLKLGPGVAYAASTMVHYVVLIVGFLAALNVLGIDLSKYSVLVGALGVGLGFGLQNIMNNFVSGIILLFERPIKVGDVIQVDTTVGTVESIGIRASVIRMTNGSEIIMPNGNLISNQVTNWTFSDRQRAIDLPVAVAAKADPQKVISILIEVAKAHPEILKTPPPQVLFTNFSGNILNFELRAWTGNQESWSRTRSDLSLAVTEALNRENIAMA